MSTITLRYFDIHGGRGEPARLALFFGNIDFEDDRISLSQWPERKAEMPFRAVPVLDIDGKVIAQSNTINRYIGKLVNLYPDDPWQAALCDEIMDAIEDISQKVIDTFFITDENEKRDARAVLANGPIPLYLQRLETYLRDRGGAFFADNRLTMADLKVFVWIRHLLSGNLDYIPTEIVAKNAPLLAQHFERVSNHDKIRSYYQGHSLSM